MPDFYTEPVPHIFISYRRTVEADEALAREVVRQLSQYCRVFIDQIITVGTDWAREIEQQLSLSDYLIVFLSKDSVQSEMVRGEIETAQRMASERGGKPKILPARVAFHDALQYPLSAYLNRIQWATWENEAGTPRLLAELSKAINGSAHQSPFNVGEVINLDDFTDEQFNDLNKRHGTVTFLRCRLLRHVTRCRFDVEKSRQVKH
jgi:hypothetical protein